MKQQLSEAPAFYKALGGRADFVAEFVAIEAALVERLLPGECRHGYLVDLARVECPVCHGSGQVWDEGIVEAVAKAIHPWDDNKEIVRERARAVLSALVELLTEKVET